MYYVQDVHVSVFSFAAAENSVNRPGPGNNIKLAWIEWVHTCECYKILLIH